MSGYYVLAAILKTVRGTGGERIIGSWARHSLVPDGNVVFVPLEAHLQIMVLDHELEDCPVISALAQATDIADGL